MTNKNFLKGARARVRISLRGHCRIGVQSYVYSRSNHKKIDAFESTNKNDWKKPLKELQRRESKDHGIRTRLLRLTVSLLVYSFDGDADVVSRLQLVADQLPFVEVEPLSQVYSAKHDIAYISLQPSE